MDNKQWQTISIEVRPFVQPWKSVQSIGNQNDYNVSNLVFKAFSPDPGGLTNGRARLAVSA